MKRLDYRTRESDPYDKQDEEAGLMANREKYQYFAQFDGGCQK